MTGSSKFAFIVIVCGVIGFASGFFILGPFTLLLIKLIGVQ